MEYDIYPFHNPLVFSTWVLLEALYFSFFKITTVGTLMERTRLRLRLMNTSSKRVDYNSNWVCGKARFWPSFYRIFLALFFENKSTLKESQHGWCCKGPLEDILSNCPVQAGQPCPGGFWEFSVWVLETTEDEGDRASLDILYKCFSILLVKRHFT